MFTALAIATVFCVFLCLVLVGLCANLLTELREARNLINANSRMLESLRNEVASLRRITTGLDKAFGEFLEWIYNPIPDDEVPEAERAEAEQPEKAEPERPRVAIAEGGGHD